MCNKGCRNFGKKYTCPPYTPNFHDYLRNFNYLFVVMFFIYLDKLPNQNQYLKVRIANSVMKSRIESIMRELEIVNNSKFLSTGSCRLCKPCRLTLKQPCRYPDKRRYSLEGLGVDCSHLSKRLFSKSLRWFRNSKAPKYTSVICALPMNIKDKNLIQNKFKTLIKMF